jgi:signal transduction histidine kinase
MRIQLLTGSLSRWTLDRFSIRLRLAIWYAMLVAATLALFSVIVFAVAQYQIENSVDQGLQSNAQIIAQTVQGGLASPPSVTPGATLGATATPSAMASATPTGTATPTPSSTGTATPLPTATPVPSIDPSTKKKIQQRLELSSVVTDLLGRLNLTFEVLDANQAVVYSPSNLVASPLRLETTSLRATLRTGACMASTHSQRGSTLRIYLYPLTPPPAAGGRSAVVVSGPTGCTVAAGTPVVGVVVVAKTVDDVNTTLSTLRRLLFAGVLVALLLASLGAWFIAGNGLRPIASLTRTARSIATNAQRGGLGKRVGYRGPRDEVGELAATFDDMLAALERTANAQRRFIADASHELRAPLTTIKGSLELLRTARDLPESERAGAIEDAYAEAVRMAGLVNDLLLLARVDTATASGARLDDQMRGRRELVELDQLAFEIFRQGRVQLQAQPGAHVQLSIGALEPLAAEGDPGQLRQVLLILLDNALKYTPAGGRVSISVSQEGGRAALSVADTGIGIEPEVLPHIFERFFRGDMARERDEHGSGLGLAIAEWIVTAHGGEMRVESRPGIGSTFTILLPAMRRQGEQSSAKQAVPPPRRGVARALVAGAVAPLARLASTASRPRRLGRGPNEAAPNPHHADARAPRANGPSSSDERARRPRPRPNDR